MKRLLAIVIVFLVAGCALELRYPPARWIRDDDARPIGKPREIRRAMPAPGRDSHVSAQVEDFVLVSEELGLLADYTNVTGRFEALDTTNFDEVADSTWFTNRLGRFDLTPQEIARRPGEPPRWPWTVLEEEVSKKGPRLFIRDASGRRFEIDPETAEGAANAAVVSWLVMAAAGYNVLSASVVAFDPSALELDDPVRRAIMELVREGSGKVRAAAYEFPEGEPLGPFSFRGRRGGDSNDRIRHEHRRELRALRVFQMFLDDSGTANVRSADTFIPTGGGDGYVLHSVVPFPAALSCPDPERPEAFFPGSWERDFRNPAFQYMTDRDAFWAVRILMRLSDDAIEAIVGGAKLGDPAASRCATEALKGRRDEIGRYWFSRVAPLDNFRVGVDAEGAVISFDDLAVVTGFEELQGTTYRYCMRTLNGRAVLMPWREGDLPSLAIDGAAMRRMLPGRVYALEIQAKRAEERRWGPPLALLLRRDGEITIVGLSRRHRR